MQKLKSLRGAIGTYGRVAAGGIIEVDHDKAAKLTKSGRFVVATDDDIATAQAAQKKALAAQTAGVAPGFAPMPEAPASQDRLLALIERGEITPAEAKKLARVQIEFSTQEIQALIQREADGVMAELATVKEDLDAREQDLSAREAELASREIALAEREAAVADAAINDAATPNAIPAKGDVGTAADDKPAAAKKPGK